MRFQSFCCARTLLFRGTGDDREVLLQLRQNTGYMDGKYDASSSGHLEPGENFEQCAIRETKEEIGVILSETDIKFGTLNYDVKENYVKAVFVAELPSGAEPRICEPEVCADLTWFKLGELPDNLIPYLHPTFECLERRITYDDGDFTILQRAKATTA